MLQDAGVSAIFPPGTPIAKAAITILDKLGEKLGYAQKAAQ
jgi:methylmalonyl-CoA mutase cobalamin-binding subunit